MLSFMIYTIEYEEKCEKLLNNVDEGNMIVKVGRYEPEGKKLGYKGGTVYNNKAVAQYYLEKNYKIYGVEANWDEDVEPKGSGVGYLLEDSRIFRLKDGRN